MTFFLQAARVLLGVVLAAAGGLKLRDRTWLATASAMGVPRWVAVAVAPAEIALGATTAAGFLRPVPALLALAMLVAFTLVVARQLRLPASERPRCACFGAWSARPTTSLTLLRNLALVALGVAATLG